MRNELLAALPLTRALSRAALSRWERDMRLRRAVAGLDLERAIVAAGSMRAGSRVTTTSITVGRSRSRSPVATAFSRSAGSSTRMPRQPKARATSA
jgi:hypothetical protein